MPSRPPALAFTFALALPLAFSFSLSFTFAFTFADGQLENLPKPNLENLESFGHTFSQSGIDFSMQAGQASAACRMVGNQAHVSISNVSEDALAQILTIVERDGRAHKKEP